LTAQERDASGVILRDKGPTSRSWKRERAGEVLAVDAPPETNFESTGKGVIGYPRKKNPAGYWFSIWSQ
jgi:hypothetical protein